MMIVMKESATTEQVEAVIRQVEHVGAKAHVSRGELHTVIGAIGDREHVANLELDGLPGVDHVVPITRPYKLASLQFKREQYSVFDIGGRKVGAEHFMMIAGPCTIESRDQMLTAAAAVSEAGAQLLRGGAYKPRTSPYAFQGLGEGGLKLMAEARDRTGLPVVSEMTDGSQMELFERYVDVIQIGSRNMHNFTLLRAAGQGRTPVLLKRGFGATIDEWLMAAEYVLSAGNSNVILCERGIRTFEHATRNTLDLSAVPVLREMTHLPIVVDPSHGTGRRSLVGPMALGAAAVGADGLLIEVHPDPPHARSDGDQSLSFPEFGALMDELRRLEFLRRRDDASDTPSGPIPGAVSEMRERVDEIDDR